MPAKKFKGLMEWILDRDGHDFLVQVDRSFIRDEDNLVNLIDRLADELHLSKETLKKGRFSLFLRHLYKAAAPTPDNLQDEKYLQFIQDLVDVYGLIHSRYIRTAEGK